MIAFWLNDRAIQLEAASPNQTLLGFLRDELIRNPVESDRSEAVDGVPDCREPQRGDPSRSQRCVAGATSEHTARWRASDGRSRFDSSGFRIRLTGTKEGCAEGDCGACSVVLLDGARPQPCLRVVNSCLLLLPTLHGRRVWTVEGLRGAEYHPAQKAMAENLGSQCGYCTPGFVMSLFEATYRRDLTEPWQFDDQLCGNLCRCTGYSPIRKALREVAGTCPQDQIALVLAGESAPLAEARHAASGLSFVRPASWDALWDELSARPEARILAGGTDVALEVTKLHRTLPALVSLEAILDLQLWSLSEGVLSIGAMVPLSDVELQSRTCLPVLARMLRFFGSRQIKHRATIGGNLCNASPIGDLPPVLLALGATLRARSRRAERRISMEEFFVDYRKTALGAQEILTHIDIPIPASTARVSSYKVSKRRELDISAVAAAFFVETDNEERVIAARLAFGGMARTPARAARAERALLGKHWTEEAVTQAMAALGSDFSPISDHRASSTYRMAVARNLLLGFFIETREVRQPGLPDRPTATVAA